MLRDSSARRANKGSHLHPVYTRAIWAMGVHVGLVLLLALAAVAPVRTEPPPQRVSTKLETWLTAVTQHVSQERDSAVAQISPWSQGDLNGVIGELRKLLPPITGPEGGVPAPPPSALQQRLGLSNRANANRVLKRAALLHADIAALNRTAEGYALPSDGRARTIVDDGRQIASGGGTYHWEIGRRLLDLVPAADEDVRLWYQATSAFLQLTADHSEIESHLARARMLFPTDPLLLLYEGTLHEDYAAPRLQNFATEMADEARKEATTCSRCPRPSQLKLPFGSPEYEGRLAEMFFTRALDSDPRCEEARIRLAHVVAQRGAHKQAAATLQQALEANLPPMLRYYALILLGRERQTLDQGEAARSLYRDASALYPQAQSPRLGLSQLARDAEDRGSALRVLTLLAEPAQADPSADPWWTYNRSHVPSADELMAQLAARLSK